MRWSAHGTLLVPPLPPPSPPPAFSLKYKVLKQELEAVLFSPEIRNLYIYLQTEPSSNLKIMLLPYVPAMIKQVVSGSRIKLNKRTTANNHNCMH